MRLVALALTALALSAVGCAAHDDDPVGDDENAVKVDTSSPEARAQYDADVDFVNHYVPRCAKTDGSRPRVLLTGFGRFMSIANNATGRLVSTVVPDAKYPETDPPIAGHVDPPEPQLSVATATIDLPMSGKVDVCAMILPVYWDVAAILIAKEIDQFKPSFVMMNGVAGSRQEIWIEMGAINRAQKDGDGSNMLVPYDPKKPYAKIIDSDPDGGRPNLLHWQSVAAAAQATIEKHAKEEEAGATFGDILPGAKLGGFPRSSNTYLCNNVTYATGWLMSNPRRYATLLRASKKVSGRPNDVRIRLDGDYSKVPRVFVHWPSELDVRLHAAGADVMKTIIDAELAALARGEPASPGDNDLADPDLKGGDTF